MISDDIVMALHVQNDLHSVGLSATADHENIVIREEETGQVVADLPNLHATAGFIVGLIKGRDIDC